MPYREIWIIEKGWLNDLCSDSENGPGGPWGPLHFCISVSRWVEAMCVVQILISSVSPQIQEAKNEKLLEYEAI